MKNQKAYIWILSSLVVILVIILAFILLNGKFKKEINSYDDCVDAGYPIQESYPSRCVTPDGKSFTNPDEKVEETPVQGNDINTNTSSDSKVNPTTQNIKVYFSKGSDNPESTTAVIRTTTRSDTETFAIEQLIAGPTKTEKAQGLTTPLIFTSDYTCTDKNELLPIDFKLNIEAFTGKATLEFCRNVKDSGTVTDAKIKTTLTNTLKQFSSVDKVVILDVNGNCFGDLSGLNLCLN